MKSIPIHSRIDSDTHKALMEVAKKEDRTLSFVVARILKAEFLKKAK